MIALADRHRGATGTSLQQRVEQRIGDDAQALDVGADPVGPVDDHDRSGQAGRMQPGVVLDVPLGLDRQPSQIGDDGVRLGPLDLRARQA